MFPLTMLGPIFIILSLLTLVAPSPTNNIHITLDISLEPSTTHTSEEATCTEEGFHPDPEDCTKFFRCVDFGGKGEFTKFDFDCGPGTVYDPDLITCNHPWAVSPNSKCYQHYEKHAALEAPHDAKSRKQVPLATGGDAQLNGFECTADGIFADPGDCVTFHECTKQGDGSFTDEKEVCADGEAFCQPVGGCGPAAGCPVACAEGKGKMIKELR